MLSITSTCLFCPGKSSDVAVDEGEDKVQRVGGEQVERLPREVPKVCPCSILGPAAGGEDGVPAMGKGGDHSL